MERALLLFDQRRFEQAEEELHRVLAADPNTATAHALLALCLLEREQYQDATRSAEEAIGLAPDVPFVWYVMAQVFAERNRLTEAEDAVYEALALDPSDPQLYGLLASIFLQRKQWQTALESAEEGLQFDPEHITCNNVRAMALAKLGRRTEAGQSLDAAMTRDPDNPLSHANRGWMLLEQGNSKEALVHFREALRLDPSFQFAQSGIVEALKARNVIYRLLLMYFLWMARLPAWGQWLVILGGYFAFRFARAVARENPQLAPFLWPFLIAYLVFVIMTWLATPLFNLLLRLDRFGKYALSREQIIASNWVGGCLLLGLVGLLAFGISFLLPATTWREMFRLVSGLFAGMFALLAIPMAATFNCDVGWPRRMMALYTAALAGVGILGLLLVVAQSDSAFLFGLLFVLGLILSSWVANGLAMVTVKK